MITYCGNAVDIVDFTKQKNIVVLYFFGLSGIMEQDINFLDSNNNGIFGLKNRFVEDRFLEVCAQKEELDKWIKRNG